MKKPVAVTFAATLDPEVLRFGESKPAATLCPWCGQALAATDLDACPHCGALLKPADEALEVPGVTTLSQEALRILEVAEVKARRKTKRRFGSAPEAPSPTVAPLAPDPDEEMAAVRPPDAEVRRVMRELEIEARRAALAADAPAVASEAAPAPAIAPEPVPEPAQEPVAEHPEAEPPPG